MLIKVNLSKLFLGFSIAFLACHSDGDDLSTICIDTNCSDYTSQWAAQAAYEENKECRQDLDADKDGIACEEPGNEVRDCRKFSNCGCSNKKKADCEYDPCCRWIVGTGCRCS